MRTDKVPTSPQLPCIAAWSRVPCSKPRCCTNRSPEQLFIVCCIDNDVFKTNNKNKSIHSDGEHHDGAGPTWTQWTQPVLTQTNSPGRCMNLQFGKRVISIKPASGKDWNYKTWLLAIIYEEPVARDPHLSQILHLRPPRSVQVVNLANCYQYRQRLCAKFWQNYSALDNSSRTPFFSQSSCSGPQYWSGTPNHSESPGPMFMFTWLKRIYLKIKLTSNQSETNSKSTRSIFVVFVVVDAHRCKVVVLLVTWGASHRNLTINNHWHFFTRFKSSSSSHHCHNYMRITYFPETDHTQLIGFWAGKYIQSESCV